MPYCELPPFGHRRDLAGHSDRTVCKLNLQARELASNRKLQVRFEMMMGSKREWISTSVYCQFPVKKNLFGYLHEYDDRSLTLMGNTFLEF